MSDAILVAYSTLYSTYKKNHGVHIQLNLFDSNQTKEIFYETLTKATKSKCSEGSIQALNFLASKYSDNFPKLALIGTDNESWRTAESTSPLRDWTWKAHYCFLAQDKEGTWYAGSPANFSSSSKSFSKPYSSSNLADVIKLIQNDEGGSWPSAQFIEESLSKNYFHPYNSLGENGKSQFHFRLIDTNHSSTRSTDYTYTFPEN